MTYESAIARFIEYLSAERNLAPSTVKAYEYDLRRYTEYRVAIPLPMSVEKTDAFELKEYLAHLREEHDCRPTTLARVVSSLRTFFEFLKTSGVLESSPAVSLHHPKKPKKLPIYLVPEEARRLLTLHPGLETEEVRNRTILILLVMSGIRLAELVGLDVNSVDTEGGTVLVFGKGRKERLVPMNASLLAALKTWLASRPPGRDGCRALFLDAHGDRISRRTVQHLVKKAAKELGLDQRLSPHKLRHTFATILHSEAVDLRDIQELMGHANIASTSIYTHTNVEKARKAVDQLSLRPMAAPDDSGETD